MVNGREPYPFQNLPPTPLQKGNEIVYDFQEVRERTFSRLIDNFYLFQPLAGASLQLVPIIKGAFSSL